MSKIRLLSCSGDMELREKHNTKAFLYQPPSFINCNYDVTNYTTFNNKQTKYKTNINLNLVSHVVVLCPTYPRSLKYSSFPLFCVLVLIFLSFKLCIVLLTFSKIMLVAESYVLVLKFFYAEFGLNLGVFNQLCLVIFYLFIFLSLGMLD